MWASYSGEPGTAFVTEIDGLRDENARRLINGEPLRPVPRLTVRSYERGEFTDALGDSIGLLLLSPVLVDVLQAAGARLQVIPVSVHRRPKLAYAVANVLDRVPAIDVERSKVTTFAGTDVIDRVSRLAVRPIAADAPPIFHAAEHLPLIVVNDHLRQRLQEASTSPGVLTPIETWTNHF